jgi:hypothetical protein
MTVVIREATQDDVKIVFDLSNDPVVRSNSIRPGLIDWDEHQRWFAKKILDKNCIIFLAFKPEGEFIG